jgi:hypothetical protein
MARRGDDMAARDASMTLDEFTRYYESHRGVVSSVKAYDATDNKWVSLEDLLKKPGAYTLIVVKFKNNSFLRVTVKSSLNVRMSAKAYSNPATWASRGINLTYEEKAFLQTMRDDLSPDELIAAVASSSFEGKDVLVKKLKKATGTK